MDGDNEGERANREEDIKGIGKRGKRAEERAG